MGQKTQFQMQMKQRQKRRKKRKALLKKNIDPNTIYYGKYVVKLRDANR